MPDYLGKDQRKVKGDDEKDEKPFQGRLKWSILVVDIHDFRDYFTRRSVGPGTYM